MTKNLTSILGQREVSFEVILIDDNSTDHTEKVVFQFQKKYTNLKYIRLITSDKSKRNALTAGVKAAQFKNILVTDADCQPATPDWAHLFLAQLSTRKQMILGVSPYSAEKTYLNQLIRHETYQTAIQFLSFAKHNRAYMGLGRNMAFSKSIFDKYSQYELDQNLTSGDDDMFVQRVPQKFIAILTTPESFTFSQGKSTLKSWWRQKRRHYSTAPVYKLKDQVMLSLNGLSLLFFWALSLILLTHSVHILWCILIFIILKTAVFRRHQNLIGNQQIKWFWPLVDLNLVTFQTLILIQNSLRKPKFWS
ncbi:MAG: glycosyltransferase [Psychroflexus sp.]|nr:glycosyltransferase [Psychroflexus sp.]MDN6310754.1 glycosyltransferase [Psychroflexus sp.]